MSADAVVSCPATSIPRRSSLSCGGAEQHQQATRSLAALKTTMAPSRRLCACRGLETRHSYLVRRDLSSGGDQEAEHAGVGVVDVILVEPFSDLLLLDLGRAPSQQGCRSAVYHIVTRQAAAREGRREEYHLLAFRDELLGCFADQLHRRHSLPLARNYVVERLQLRGRRNELRRAPMFAGRTFLQAASFCSSTPKEPRQPFTRKDAVRRSLQGAPPRTGSAPCQPPHLPVRQHICSPSFRLLQRGVHGLSRDIRVSGQGPWFSTDHFHRVLERFPSAALYETPTDGLAGNSDPCSNTQTGDTTMPIAARMTRQLIWRTPSCVAGTGQSQ